MCEKSSNQYFHREELEVRPDQEEDEYMSTNMEATNTVLWLQLHCPAATASLQEAVHEALMPATATQPPDEEYYYYSDDSVLDLDEEFPELAERVMQWQAACQDAASAPPWRPSSFSEVEWACYDKLPDLWDILNQAKEARAHGHVPVQLVVPMPLPFASVRDLDCLHQQCHDQTLAKRQSSLLDGEQCKWAKTPPQPDPHDASDREHGQTEQRESRGRGRSMTRSECRQQVLDRVQSKSRKRSKSRK